MSLSPSLKLLDFQAQDIEKLSCQTSALIANGMGTGKTIEGLARDARIRENNQTDLTKTLVVAPLTVLDHWADHFKRYTDLVVTVIDPKNRQRFLTVDAQVYILHWEALRKMPELAMPQWLHVIADEVHKAQNRKAQQTQALKKIKTLYKTGLSGSPITNTPDKMWSILNWLYPKEFSSYWRFYGKHVDYDVIPPEGYHKIKGPKNLPDLHKKIRPYYVRHLKMEACCPLHPKGVQPDMPEKYWTEIKVNLKPEQHRAYQQMKHEKLAWVGTNEDSPVVAPIAVAQLTRLQQFACAYAEVNSMGSVRLSEPSSKLDAVMELIEDNPEEPIVVFSQFEQMISLLEKRLIKAKIPVSVFTGRIPASIRKQNKKHFIEGRHRVFAGTIAAGGVGIELTRASTVIFTDRTWSPPLNEQAEDRLHRMGQKNPVQVIDLVARGTVDLGRHQRLAEKWTWIKALLDGNLQEGLDKAA